MTKATLNDLKLELWLRKRNSSDLMWETINGKRIAIKDMSTDHLINSINLLERRQKLEDLNDIEF